MLRVKLPHLAAWTEARRRNADRYRELFAPLAATGQVELPVEPDGLLPHLQPVRDPLAELATA